MITLHTAYKMNKNAVHDVMANAGIWSAVGFQAVINDVEVSARIPQSALKKDGTIKKQVIDLIKNPCIQSKRKLLVLYKVMTSYRPLSPKTPGIALPAAA